MALHDVRVCLSIRFPPPTNKVAQERIIAMKVNGLKVAEKIPPGSLLRGQERIFFDLIAENEDDTKQLLAAYKELEEWRDGICVLAVYVREDYTDPSHLKLVLKIPPR